MPLEKVLVAVEMLLTLSIQLLTLLTSTLVEILEIHLLLVVVLIQLEEI